MQQPNHPTGLTKASATSRALLAKMEEIREKLQKNKEPTKTEATLTDAKLLAKLDAWITGLPASPCVQQPSPLQPTLNDLVQKTPFRKENTAILAAYTEPNKKETPDYMREIRRMDERMEDKLEGLYRQTKWMLGSVDYSETKLISTHRTATRKDTRWTTSMF